MGDNPNLGALFDQARKVQERMQEVQQRLGDKTVEGRSGGGMVVAVANGKQELLRLVIDPAILGSEDKQMLEDLITAAVNDALNRSRALIKEEFSSLTSGISLPDFLK